MANKAGDDGDERGRRGAAATAFGTTFMASRAFASRKGFRGHNFSSWHTKTRRSRSRDDALRALAAAAVRVVVNCRARGRLDIMMMLIMIRLILRTFLLQNRQGRLEPNEWSFFAPRCRFYSM
jgi:hypothetical protein